MGRGGPVMGSGPVWYEMSERISGTHSGGIGAVRMVVRATALAEAIDEELQILKQHHPYFDSDHILNITYNIMSGGQSLEDLEVRRKDGSYMGTPWRRSGSAIRRRSGITWRGLTRNRSVGWKT